ncbi:MAG: hypothetical protein ACU843_10165 [Gammaproteobacteria bacterium]
MRKAIPEMLKDAENSLTTVFRESLNELYEELVHLVNCIASVEGKQGAIRVGNQRAR